MTAGLPPPDEADARAAAGVLCHFVASDAALTEAFRAWVEHHPGDLDCEQIVWYLGLVHDLLSPECAEPATTDLRPDRRLRVLVNPFPVAEGHPPDCTSC